MISSFFRYWLLKLDQYSLHSPILFSIYQELINYKKNDSLETLELEKIRKLLLQDKKLLNIEDYGAGSKRLKTKIRSVAEVTKHSTSQKKYNKLYQFFCMKTPAQVVIELGTCTGLNAQYLAKVTKGTVHTFEGSKSLWEIAQFYNSSPTIKYHFGEISQTLPEFLSTIPAVDFALIDATHTQEGTLSYFDTLISRIHSKSILVVADIHWSSEMELAWKKIKNHPKVQLTFDFFECGIVFFDPELPNDYLILDY